MSLDGREIEESQMEGILARLRNDEPVVYPTSTLPGLGVIPTPKGLDNLFLLKGRASNQPVSLGVHSLEQVNHLVHIPLELEDLLASFPRGSITVLLKAVDQLDQRLGGEWVGVRVFEHPIARKLAKRCGPITATSANPSGIACALDVQMAAKSLGLPAFSVLQGVCGEGQPSTLVRLESKEGGLEVIVMREGMVPKSVVVEWNQRLR